MNQLKCLENSNPRLAANKRLVYDFDRIVLKGLRLEQASKFLREDYIQHHPNVETGLSSFIQFFSHLGGTEKLPNTGTMI